MQRSGWGMVAWWVFVLGVFFAQYSVLPWWRFIAATVLLVGAFVFRWRRQWREPVGLGGGWRLLAGGLVAAGALWAYFHFVVWPGLSADNEVTRQAHRGVIPLVFAFQALNEEMILGALLLFGLVDAHGRPVLWCVVTAVVFAGLHDLLYRFGAIGIPIAPLTLLGLVAVGVLRGALILATRSIAFAWALHAAWNVMMFGGVWWRDADGSRLSEPAMFDAFVGDPRVVALTTAAAAIMLVVLWRRGAPPARYQVSA